MSSICMSKCVNDARVRVRGTYVNLYKWPESEAEFVRRRGSHVQVVDSISCRQMYLRSYKFSRKETVPQKTQKCFGRIKGTNSHRLRSRTRSKCLVWTKITRISSASFFRIFRRFLSCTATVDVLH